MDFHRINDYLPKVTIVHLSPRFEKEIIEELENIAKEINHPLSIAHEGKTLSI
jgi:hypothetical protein